LALTRLQNDELIIMTGRITAELQQLAKLSKSFQILTQKIVYIQQDRIVNSMTEKEIPQNVIDEIFELIKSKYETLFPILESTPEPIPE